MHLGLVDVGGDDARAFRGEGERGGAADPLAGGGDEGGLVGEPSGMAYSLLSHEGAADASPVLDRVFLPWRDGEHNLA